MGKLGEINTQVFGILLTPQTDKKDIIEAFNRYKAVLKELQSSPETYALTDERVDEKTEVKRDRNWYWKKVNGMSYWQIAEKEGIDKDHFVMSEKDLIVKAIKSYRKKLL